jgi:hypothetical protein
MADFWVKMGSLAKMDSTGVSSIISSGFPNQEIGQPFIFKGFITGTSSYFVEDSATKKNAAMGQAAPIQSYSIQYTTTNLRSSHSPLLTPCSVFRFLFPLSGVVSFFNIFFST